MSDSVPVEAERSRARSAKEWRALGIPTRMANALDGWTVDAVVAGGWAQVRRLRNVGPQAIADATDALVRLGLPPPEAARPTPSDSPVIEVLVGATRWRVTTDGVLSKTKRLTLTRAELEELLAWCARAKTLESP